MIDRLSFVNRTQPSESTPRKKQRTERSKSLPDKTQCIGLQTLALDPQEHITEFLDFPDRRALGLAHRQFQLMVDDGPFYRNLLGLNRTHEPENSTCAERLRAAIKRGNGLIILRTAEALYSFGHPYGPKRTFISSLLKHSSATTKESNSIGRIPILSNLHMTGHPTGKSDRFWWAHHTAAAGDTMRSKKNRVQAQIHLMTIAVQGFCDPAKLLEARQIAATICQDDTLAKPLRVTGLAFGDVLDYLTTSNFRTKQIAWRRWQAHFNGESAVQELTPFATLLDLQRQYTTHARDSENDEAIATSLEQLYQNPQNPPHYRALAGIQLAIQRYEARTNIINDIGACKIVDKIGQEECLRENVRQEAILILGTFRLHYRCPEKYVNDEELLRIARLCIAGAPYGDHGLCIDRPIWGRKTLVRLHVQQRVMPSISLRKVFKYANELSVDEQLSRSDQRIQKYNKSLFRYRMARHLTLFTAPGMQFQDRNAIILLTNLLNEETNTEALLDIRLLIATMHVEGRGLEKYTSDTKAFQFAKLVWNQSEPGSSRHADAGIVLAKLYLRKATPGKLQEQKQVIACLRAIISASSSTLRQTSEARLLLARCHFETATLLISRKEAMACCSLIHRNPDVCPVIRKQAAELSPGLG